MDYLNYLNNLLETAVSKKASDLHISVGHPPILRITRELVDLEDIKVINTHDAEGLAFALLTPQQKEIFLKERSIDLAYELKDESRFRVNVFFQSNKISIAFRLIGNKIKTIEELNLPLTLYQFTKANQGLVLITGATSQGKSTTLAALVDEINHQTRRHIITIEDPIEYVFADDKCIIDQREVHKDTLSFARALKAALREDPDVIMVGELRDLESIATAITAAETGHLVLGTLHTNSASQTIHRLIDVFPPAQQSQIRAQLAFSLLGVVSQRLLPSLQGGFIPGCEVMVMNPAVANLIRESKIHEISSIIETSLEKGMVSMNQSLADLVFKKIIDYQTALDYSLNPSDLSARLNKM